MSGFVFSVSLQHQLIVTILLAKIVVHDGISCKDLSVKRDSAIAEIIACVRGVNAPAAVCFPWQVSSYTISTMRVAVCTNSAMEMWGYGMTFTPHGLAKYR